MARPRRRLPLLAAGALLPLLAVGAVLTTALAEDSPASPPSVTSGAGAPLTRNLIGPGTPAGDARAVRIAVGGRERAYLLLPPIGLPRDRRPGLVVVLHQDVATPREVAVELELDVLRRHGVALAYPAAIGGSWNAGACCGTAARDGIDDVGFVSAVVADAGRRSGAHPDRRAVLGYSGGGMLALRIACQAPQGLAAVVEVNGSLEAHCPRTVRLPDLLSVHGARDGTVGLHRRIRVHHLGMAPRPVTSTLSIVTERADCRDRTAERVTEETTWVDVVRWTRCRGGAGVDALVVGSAGHRWADVGGASRTRSWLLERVGVRSRGA